MSGRAGVRTMHGHGVFVGDNLEVGLEVGKWYRHKSFGSSWSVD